MIQMATATVKKIVLPYTPRKIWKATIHSGLEHHRFSVGVCHRRFGKTVGLVNHMIKQAVLCDKRAPQYAYIAPFFNQAKKIAWEYLKYYTGPIPGHKVNNSDCYIELPTKHPGSPGARIYIMGADKPDSLRGMYLDGVVLDEFGQMKDSLWGEIIRPCLADRKGWAVFIGTPKGQNAFYKKYLEGLKNPDWYTFLYKASETGVLDEEELASMRASMNEVEYAQELECNFSVAAYDMMLGAADIEIAVNRNYKEAEVYGQPRIVGVDIAGAGNDSTVIAMRQGLAVMPLKVFQNVRAMDLASIIIQEKQKFKADALFIDNGAMGPGVIDRIRQLGHQCFEVNFGAKASDSVHFRNRRAEMYFNLVDYIKDKGLAIPDDDMLREELANIQYKTNIEGPFQLVLKQKIKELIGRSPDRADALALLFAEKVIPQRTANDSNYIGNGPTADREYNPLQEY